MGKPGHQGKRNGKYMCVKSYLPGQYMNVILFKLKEADIVLHGQVADYTLKHQECCNAQQQVNKNISEYEFRGFQVIGA